MDNNKSAYKIKKFYAASNSHNGFYSLFDSIFSSEKLKRIYIIKGGPGCGKSTAMKAISDHAAKNDFEVVEYFCSSSPSSLDGVIIPQLSSAVLDGTSPHTVDPKFPAVCENIVDFGVSWNIDKAKTYNNEIKKLNNEKANAYRRAYAYLSSCMSAKKVKINCLESYLLEDKMISAIERICSKLKIKKSAGKLNKVFTDCISGKGNIHLDTFEKNAETRYFIKDFAETSHVFFKYLADILSDIGADITVALNPLFPDHYCGIWLPDDSISFTIYDDCFAESLDKKQIPYKIINLSRFCNYDIFKKNKTIFKYADKSENFLMNGAIKQLALASDYHDKIENAYHNFTDYKKIAEITNELIKDIF